MTLKFLLNLLLWALIPFVLIFIISLFLDAAYIAIVGHFLYKICYTFYILTIGILLMFSTNKDGILIIKYKNGDSNDFN